MTDYKVLAINPGSTSTKVAIFKGEKCLFSKNIQHEARKLAQFQKLSDQLPYRRKVIHDVLKMAHVSLSDIDVCVGRGGGLISMAGGTYVISKKMLDDARNCANGVVHPAALGPQLADEFAREYGTAEMVVNPPDVDELQDLARMTGIKGVNRVIHLHALNLKETAIRHCKTVLHDQYKNVNLIVCHIGGGISVSAHRQGLMVDGFDIVNGEGPMAPTRCGSISVGDLITYMDQNKLNIQDVKSLMTKEGGFVSHFGMSNALAVYQRGSEGDDHAKMVWNTMVYQIEKCIGAMAAVLHGKVDGILLSGGMVHNQDLVRQITEICSFIAPVTAYPGEFEMEAMAAGVIRAIKGEEPLKEYTGKPVWAGFEWDK